MFVEVIMTLNAGKGAEASVLTKFIRPQQPLPGGDVRNHRSVVILVDKFVNEKGKLCYRFKYPLSNNEELMFATARYVKVTREGEPSLFFDEPVAPKRRTKFVEPSVKWRNSVAKMKLYEDVNTGKVPIDSKEQGNNRMSLKQIYLMHPEYADYDFQKFSNRLSSIRKTVTELKDRAVEDQKAFDLFVRNNEVSLFSYGGYIEWQGSRSQQLLLEDIEAGKLEEYAGNKKEWYLSRPEYYNEFPLKVFRDKIDQEVGTAKYLHTLKVKGKMHKSS